MITHRADAGLRRKPPAGIERVQALYHPHEGVIEQVNVWRIRRGDRSGNVLAGFDLADITDDDARRAWVERMGRACDA
jgi:hypothetical protein